MSDFNELEQKDEIMYKGSSVPKLIKGAWFLFLIWALAYAIWYVIPDLKIWFAE